MELIEKLTLLKEELELENNLLKKKLKEKDEYMKELKKQNTELIENNKSLREELDAIIYSRSYKIIQKCKRLIKRG